MTTAGLKAPAGVDQVASCVQLGKRYGDRWALRNVDLELIAGDVVGFIGPNGAGKSTLIKLLTGLARPSEGQVTVLGRDLVRTRQPPTDVGLVIEQPTFVPHLSGQRNLELLAAIRGVADRRRIRETLALVGLDPDDRRRARAYSLGMRQRLALAQAVMERPRLLVLDEPTNGLDPQGVVEIRDLLQELASGGTTVLLASHLLTEVERLCQRVLLVASGRVRRVLDLRDPGAEVLHVYVADHDETTVRSCATRHGWQLEPAGGDHPGWARWRIRADDVDTPDVVRALVAAGVSIAEVTRAGRSLEQEYLDVVTGPAT